MRPSGSSDGIGGTSSGQASAYPRTDDGIVAATQGRAFEDVQGNLLYEGAVERAVQIISEAARELPADLRERHAGVHWQPIIRIGNLLRHEYYRIRARDMWEIATVHLPVLRPVIVRMLSEFES